MSWSKIPMTLRIAALAVLALAISDVVLQPFASLLLVPRYWMFRTGVSFAAKCFAIYGAVELAGIVRVRAAVGAKLAAAGWTVTIALWFIDTVVSMANAWRDPIGVTLQWIWWAALLAVGIGLAIAAFRRPVLAIAGAVLWLAIERPPVFDEWLRKQMIGHYEAQRMMNNVQLALQGVVVLVLAAAAVGDVPDDFAIRDPQRIRWGHTKIANSLWLRVIAVSALPLVTLMIMGSQNSASLKALGYAMIVAGFINTVSLLGFGLGALDVARANQPDLRRLPFYLAAAGSLWCAGAMIYQLPHVYEMLFGDHSGFLAETSADTAAAFAIVLPLVGAAAIVMWTVGAGGFALRRERLDLSERAQRTAVWFVVLSGASLGVSQWLLPEARSDGSMMLLLLLALACGLVAIVNAARLARDMAELGQVEQATIPTATML